MLVLLVNTRLLNDLAHCSGLLGVFLKLCHAGWYVRLQGISFGKHSHKILSSSVVCCRSSMGNGKARSKKAGKVQSLRQQASADMDLDELTARSNTATPGPSEDDVQSEQV